MDFERAGAPAERWCPPVAEGGSGPGRSRPETTTQRCQTPQREQVLLSGDIHNKHQESDAAPPTAGDEGLYVSAQMRDLLAAGHHLAKLRARPGGSCALRGQRRDSSDGRGRHPPSEAEPEGVPTTRPHRCRPSRGPGAASGRFAVVRRPPQHPDPDSTALRRARRHRVPAPTDTQRRAAPPTTADNHTTRPQTGNWTAPTAPGRAELPRRAR